MKHIEYVYADLVSNGSKTLEQVPPKHRAAVESILKARREERGIREETERAQAENAFLDESLYKEGE